MPTVAERFFKLFRANPRGHGTYTVSAEPLADGVKREGRRSTVFKPVTLPLVQQHLAGTYGLGAVPILPDNTCWWAAIDIDVYSIDLKAVARRITALALPLVPCRTKSGGLHCYLFLNTPLACALVRPQIAEWAAKLGYPGVEIFPKQDTLTEDGIGNWINLPYQNAADTTRYALGENGEQLSFEQFLDYAEKLATSAAPEEDTADLWSGAPPCHIALADRDFPTDYCNNMLFNFAVLLKKRYGVAWEPHLETYNALLHPPCKADEVKALIKSINKKDYSYKCKEEPIAPYCNKAVCLTCDYGVGAGVIRFSQNVIFGRMRKLLTEPPTYVWPINGVEIEMQAEDFLTQAKFRALVVKRLNIYLDTMKGKQWVQLIRAHLDDLEEVDVPTDATREGQFIKHLERFCTSRAKGRAMDEILLGKPYTNGTGRTYFISTYFFEWLQQHRFAVTEQTAAYWLNKLGAGHHDATIKGKPVTYWSIPSFTEQSEAHTPPELPHEEAM